MATGTGTGLDRQIGYALESSYGTAVTVTRFLPHITDTLQPVPVWVESKGQIAGQLVQRSQQLKLSRFTVGGDIEHELYDQSMGMLLKAAFGTAATSGTLAPYTHTFTPSGTLVSLTCQTGIVDTRGSVVPYTYGGVMVKSWRMAMKAEEIVTWGMSVTAAYESTGTALASASYATNIQPWLARFGTLTIDGTTVPVREFDIGGDNAYDENRIFVGSTIPAQPLRVDLTKYTGSFTADFGYPAAMGTGLAERFMSGTESTLVMTLVSGTLSGTITANVKFEQGHPTNDAGNGITPLKVNYRCVAPTTSDASALTIVLKNNDSTP